MKISDLMESDFEKNVLDKLPSDAVKKLSADDTAHMKRDIEDKRKQGWLPAEVAQLLRNTEEIDPDLDEDKALANMRRIRDNVSKRLESSS